jgi:hypothetical protein
MPSVMQRSSLYFMSGPLHKNLEPTKQMNPEQNDIGRTRTCSLWQSEEPEANALPLRHDTG